MAGAEIALDDLTLNTDSKGQVELPELTGPVVATVRADGFLPEPLPLGWESNRQQIDVVLLDAAGRIALHFGGDAMMGRRYEEPSSGEPLLPSDDIPAGAADVVSSLARAFSAADFRSLNLETVVSERGLAEAYPGKRFLLRSHPHTLSALELLQIDVAGLANNHARDWLDSGISDTLRALEHSGIPCLGAGLSRQQAEAPLITEVGGIRVGVLAYTTVTGSFVNDNYPDQDRTPPSNLPEKDAWLYETRTWSFESEHWSMPDDEYRIGAVWSAFKEMEGQLSEATLNEAWAAMTETFPELQDWVARRGHGGAAMWRTGDATAEIEELASEVDLVIVQLHSGFQFQVVASTTIRAAARAAIDAGAHLIIGHHPHVLQGMEWYKGRLIVHSLGNFIFDQDFLSTFASGFLRTVWQGDELVAARFVPLQIVGYRPTPEVDRAARQTLRRVWERSVLPANSARDSVSGGVYPFHGLADMHTEPLHMLFEHNTARLVSDPNPVSVEFNLRHDQIHTLDSSQLIPARLGLRPGDAPHVFIGRDIFGWGRFEDEMADGIDEIGEAHWSVDSEDEQILVGYGPAREQLLTIQEQLEEEKESAEEEGKPEDTREVSFGFAESGRGHLWLYRDHKNGSLLTIRPVARIALTRHRLYQPRDDAETGAEGDSDEAEEGYGVVDMASAEDDAPQALDPAATYGVLMKARCDTECKAYVRFDIYEFDDTNPTEDPESVLLLRHVMPLTVTNSKSESREVAFDPLKLTGSDRANMVMIYLMMDPPPEGSSNLEIDDLSVVEWRQASAMPEIHGAFTHAKSTDGDISLTFEALSAQRVTE